VACQVAINTSISGTNEFLQHIVASTNMKCLSFPGKALAPPPCQKAHLPHPVRRSTCPTLAWCMKCLTSMQDPTICRGSIPILGTPGVPPLRPGCVLPCVQPGVVCCPVRAAPVARSPWEGDWWAPEKPPGPRAWCAAPSILLWCSRCQVAIRRGLRVPGGQPVRQERVWGGGAGERECEKQPDGKLAGYIRIRSKTQGSRSRSATRSRSSKRGAAKAGWYQYRKGVRRRGGQGGLEWGGGGGGMGCGRSLVTCDL